jgi:hypothetical protein
VISSFAALCHSEASSLAKPYLSEASGLVGVPCPEATRSVDMSRHHFACEGPVCRFCSSDSREDAWTTPIVVDYKLIECPSCFNTRCGGLFCPCASGDHSPPRSPGDPPEHQHRIKQPEGPRRVWRKPRQPDPPLICIPSSSTSQSPTQEVKLEPAVNSSPAGDDSDAKGHASEATVLGSDRSQAIIIETSNALHEVEEDDELSEVSSLDYDERGAAEMDIVNSWRTMHFLQHDLDFAYVFVDFEQAYAQAGRAVARAWHRAKLWVEPETTTVDSENMEALCKMKVAKSPFLRQPGESGNPGKPDVDKVRFIEPLAQLMMDFKIGHNENASATDKEIMTALRHKATQVSDAANIPTLHIAVTTANEVREYLEYRAAHMGGSMDPILLQDFLRNHRARIRAITAVSWMCDNLHLGWPIDKAVEPNVEEESFHETHTSSEASTKGKASAMGPGTLVKLHSLAKAQDLNGSIGVCQTWESATDRWIVDLRNKGLRSLKPQNLSLIHEATLNNEIKQAPAAQPGMLKVLENAMEAAAEGSNPTWLALLASWLQAMAKLRLAHLLRRSFPIKLYNGWMLFFCKQGRQEHDRAGFCWGVPSSTSSGYKWTRKFLTNYDTRRHSNVGRKMMGMIFRTDTLEYLCSKTVDAITMDAIASAVDNPRWSTTYSWKRMLPTVALHLNFSPEERLEVGDWKDTEAISDADTKEDAASNWWLEDESPITVKYDNGKEGKNRVRRLICAKVLATLSMTGTQTFDEVPARQWELLSIDAKSKVESMMREIRVCWRNPDFAEAVGVLKMKKYQITFPKHLFTAEHSNWSPHKGAHWKEDMEQIRASSASSASTTAKSRKANLLGGSCGWAGAKWKVVIPVPSTVIMRSERELDSSIIAELAHGELVEQVGVCILPSGLARLRVECVPAAGWVSRRSSGEKVDDHMKLIGYPALFGSHDQAAVTSNGSAHVDGYVGAVWKVLVPMPIRAGKDTSTAEIDRMPAGSMVLQPNLPLKRKGCMRVRPKDRHLPAVQGWVTPIGRAGDGGNEVRYLEMISTSGPALPPPPLPHPPSSCRPMNC